MIPTVTPRRALAASLALACSLSAQAPRPHAARDWPVVTAEMKPWTRWWWQGSAVDRASLSQQLGQLRDAGLGGVEITPIYGVRGAERHFIQYLSGEWVRMLEYTLAEAERLGLGVDMATGTGWPFGGPWVGDDTASRTIVRRTWTLAGGSQLREPVRLQQTPLVRAIGNQIHIVNEGAPGDPPRGGAASQPVTRAGVRALQIGDLVEPLTANRNLQSLALEQVRFPRDLPLVALIAYDERGSAVDLTRHVSSDRTLQWTAPPGTWTLHGVFAGWHGKLVERAAPGGEGYVIDHFSRAAIRHYLGAFDRAFANARVSGLRAFFNDSYEVDDATGQADWTPTLFDEFQTRRGYDLRRHLPALFGREADDRSLRVLGDYRQTISDLLLERFTAEWTQWAHGRPALTRNQAHGSPASLLDLYAASDIPETEGTEIQRFKWASSAAHVAGKRLVAAEAATWLGEHFRSTLADVRAALDRFFVAGVNHVVYHGTPYSPGGEPWPGWLFYASVEFTPQNAWWDDFAALNGYVTRVQSLLQSGAPDHDVLVYYPLYDALATTGRHASLTHFGGANPPATNTAFEAAAAELQNRGFTYDFVSDRQLRATRIADGRLITGGKAAYRTVVLPLSRFLEHDTLAHALALARAGATVIAYWGLAEDVPGLADLESRRAAFKSLVTSVPFGVADADGISEARIGRGRLLRGGDLERLLARAGVNREPMADQGLQFARRRDENGRIYFVSNPGAAAIDGWVPLDLQAAAITVFDPVRGTKGSGRARRTPAGTLDVYLQIPPGGSLLLAAAPVRDSRPHEVYKPAGDPVALTGSWTVRFVKGGPELPANRTIDRLTSWTRFDEAARRFAGTARYTTTFARPSARADAWVLSLGTVHESARVRLNGRALGTVIGPTFTLVLDAGMLEPANELAIDVTNLSANRIADLDRRGAGWKKFYNVNYPARLAGNRGEDGLFTAAAWPPLDSGLLGPVQLTPLVVMP